MSQDNLAYKTESSVNVAPLTPAVHKFGGSSLASAKCIFRVINIIKNHCQQQDIVVVSANGDTTDALIAILESKLESALETQRLIVELHTLQRELISDVLGSFAEPILTALTSDIEFIQRFIKGEEKTANNNDILAFGELWSARLLAKALAIHHIPSQAIDARTFLTVGKAPACDVFFSDSQPLLLSALTANCLSVITGYIAKNAQGESTTLGRNGSDYSATIFADLVGANKVTLWTDVDGIYSADPRVVPTARKLHRLPNNVANELGRLGNPVLHVNTLKPLARTNIHLHICSSFQPDNNPTEVGDFGQIAQQEISVTSLNNLLVAQIDGLTNQHLDILSENCPLLHADVKTGVVIKPEHQLDLIQYCNQYGLSVTFAPCSLLAAVGFNITERSEIKARFKRAVKQGQPFTVVYSNNKQSIIALFGHETSVELLNKVHHKLTKDARNIGLVVVGLGNIGQRFIEMLPEQIQRVAEFDHLHLVGLVSSKKAYINNDGIDAATALPLFKKHAQQYDQDQLMTWLTHHPYDELVVVDITPSESFSDLYHQFFAHGIHVIGANKWAASSSEENYQSLLKAAEKTGSYWYGNTTVGAGLPINFAINDLLNSGDKIEEISGVFSGTLSWLFETYDGESSFSALLKSALAQGITEPDPREDLSGRDVQRKLLILARAAGFQLSLDDIECQNLVPETLQNLSLAEFLAQAEQLDGLFADHFQAAKKQAQCIRYVARFSQVDNKLTAKVSLEYLSTADAFANLTPCDNIFQIRSAWYRDNPLIIRGPGAGRDVTAGGLQSDLVKLCQQLALTTKRAKIKGLN